MESIRQEKVQALLMRDLGDILRVLNPEILPGTMISVTEVRISPDLAYAKVYLSFFPVQDKQEAIQKVKDKAGEIRYSLGKKVGKQLRVVPELQFILDDSLDQANRIDELLKS